jgi:transposase InsO family protein
MLVELRVGEQRLRAVWEVLDGASVSEVARRFGVSRQSVHSWLRRYAADQGLGDRSSRPHGCPHQMSPVVEARIVEIRRAHPGWGADRIGYQLHKDGTVPVPGRTSIYRALLRNGLVSPGQRRRRRADYRRWERARPMELWQMDVVGGFHLADGTELKAVSGIDDSSRFAVSAQLVRRATAGPVCEALLAALRRHGIPEQILTDNGKVFTGRFGPAGSSAEVLFDRICAENGIRHLLTAPRSPTTTGKVERWHKTIRAEFLRDHDHQHATIAGLQAALDGWVNHYNTERPHQALGMRPPIDRFRLAAAQLDPAVEAVLEPVLVPAERPVVEPATPIVRLPGVQRWVDQHGLISLAGFRYRVPIVLAGEPVEAVAAEHLVRIFHRDVLVAEHVQRRKPDTGDPQQQVRLRQGSRRPRRATDGLTVTRVVDSSGYVSFAGTNYRVANAWRGRPVQVCIVADSVQLSCDGQIVRVHPIRHDWAKEHGAFATPNGRPRHREDAPAGDGVKATPLRGRPTGRALTPTPHTGAFGSDAEPPDPHNDVDHVKQVPELIRQAGTGT